MTGTEDGAKLVPLTACDMEYNSYKNITIFYNRVIRGTQRETRGVGALSVGEALQRP